eukprot:CAMPEP_0197872568 /NCGR_PEP_ID=MMETSP1439-20131203/2643_1 /TAXON_ID=66791 /ORGANISM="Gonyaulax spinifera, Strain CCMP409" /LENGTH=118 /DNA_ID=CAMNT_0043491569 /DNA_START=45 /DNA_END=397 /DNA_ORIENTATION=-
MGGKTESIKKAANGAGAGCLAGIVLASASGVSATVAVACAVGGSVVGAAYATYASCMKPEAAVVQGHAAGSVFIADNQALVTVPFGATTVKGRGVLAAQGWRAWDLHGLSSASCRYVS